MDNASPDYGQVFDLTTACYAIVRADYRIVAANDAFCDLVQRDRARLVDAPIFDLLPESPDRQAEISQAFDCALSGDAAIVERIPFQTQDVATDLPKTDIWWTMHCTPLPRVAGAGGRVLCQINDITSEVKALQTRVLLADELQHRIGNVLNLVQVLARKTGQNYDSLDTFLPAFENRISALGKTHAFLSGTNWDGMTLRDIIDQQLSHNLVTRPEAVTIGGPEWRLSVLHAQAFAMAIHELVMNSVQYGALGAASGELVVTWDHPKDGSYHFVWQERGVQDLVQPESAGFGMQMLTRLLPGQLGGKAVRAFTPTGFHYALVVPEDTPVPVGQKRDPAKS